MMDNYFWYSTIPKVDADNFKYSDTSSADSLLNSMQYYLNDLKSPSVSASGHLLDQFSVVMPTTVANDFFDEGQLTGSGLELAVINAAPPRLIRISQVHPSSPAATSGIKRGDKINAITVTQGSITRTFAVIDGDPDSLTSALFYPLTGNTYRFDMETTSGEKYTFTFTPKTFTEQPVPLSKVMSIPSGKVGYLVFNDHTLAAEKQLLDTFKQFKQQGVEQLILDMRYNGGGYIHVANALASMVTAPVNTGKVFESLRFNDKNTYKNTSIRIADSYCGGTGSACTFTEPFPKLGLSKVYVLTSNQTCSASEALINGLRGLGIEVVTVGSTTCGKPYGFIGQDNCGLSYYVVEFAGFNAKGVGDYVDGFSPSCPVQDDLEHELGDPTEQMFATALHHLATGSCNLAAVASRQVGRYATTPYLIETHKPQINNPDAIPVKSPMREMLLKR